MGAPGLVAFFCESSWSRQNSVNIELCYRKRRCAAVLAFLRLSAQSGFHTSYPVNKAVFHSSPPFAKSPSGRERALRGGCICRLHTNG